jgi:hypothetical protein
VPTHTTNKPGVQPPPAEADTNPAPRGVLTWSSGAERNRLLMLWRRAVFGMFGEQSRCTRVAWVLADLFHGKTGYAYASNAWLANETLIPENKLRATLATLEAGGAIVRSWVVHNGQKQRVVYPSSALLPRPNLGQGEVPQQPGHLNLIRKKARLPKTEHERALLAHGINERRRSERLAQRTPEQRDPSLDPALQPPPSERRH